MKKIIIFILLSLVIMPLAITPLFAEESSASGADLLYKYHFISGDNGNLMLSKPLTRAEVAVILSEMKGLKEEAANFALPPSFSDVSPTAWYAPYIAFGQTRGYLNGYPDRTYHPDANVTSKEFAAFILNAMGYNGDYNFNDALTFASTKKINIKTSGYTFDRNDAFEALWQAVNQPIKGSDVPLGIALGKLESVESTSAVKPETPVEEVKAESTKKFIVKFKSPVSDTSRFVFKVTRNDYNILVTTSWNDSDNVATLTSSTGFTNGDYKIVVTDATHDDLIVYDPYTVTIEKERAAKVIINSDVLSLYTDYVGTVSFNVYNQYDENITNSSIARNLIVECSISDAKVDVDYNTGLILIEYGSDTSGVSLKDWPSIYVYFFDRMSTLNYSKPLVPSSQGNTINDIIINGITNEDGNFVDFVYDPNKDYYLDISVIDVSGNYIKSRKVLDTEPSGRDPLIVRSSNESLVTVQKVTHPLRNSEIAYKIIFHSAPEYDTNLLFTAIAPYSTGKNTSAAYSTTLKQK